MDEPNVMDYSEHPALRAALADGNGRAFLRALMEGMPEPGTQAPEQRLIEAMAAAREALASGRDPIEAGLTALYAAHWFDWDTLRHEQSPPSAVWHEEGEIIGSGEVMVLAGAGGLGKSFAALELGMSCVAALGTGRQGVTTEVGVLVAPCPVVYLGFEDAPFRMKDRMAMIEAAWTRGATLGDTFGSEKRPPVEWASGAEGRGGQFVFLEGRRPIYAIPGGKERGAPAPTPGWKHVWDAVRTIGAGMLIVDAAASAYMGPPNDAASVRGFIDDLSDEANAANCAVVLLAHSTKAGRQASSGGEWAGAGAISGSAAWYDASRSVAMLTTPPLPERPPKPSGAKASERMGAWEADLEKWRRECDTIQKHHRVLTIEKSNYGMRGWQRELRSRWVVDDEGNEQFAGFAMMPPQADENETF